MVHIGDGNFFKGIINIGNNFNNSNDRTKKLRFLKSKLEKQITIIQTEKIETEDHFTILDVIKESYQIINNCSHKEANKYAEDSNIIDLHFTFLKKKTTNNNKLSVIKSLLKKINEEIEFSEENKLSEIDNKSIYYENIQTFKENVEMENKYINHGQVAAMGDNAISNNNNFIQNSNSNNFDIFLGDTEIEELKKLISRLKSQDSEIKNFDEEVQLDIVSNLIKVQKAVETKDQKKQKTAFEKFRSFLFTDLGNLSEQVKQAIGTSSAVLTIGDLLQKALSL